VTRMVALPNLKTAGGGAGLKVVPDYRNSVRARTKSISPWAIASCFFLIVDTGFLNGAQNPARSANPQADADQLVREVIQNERQAQADDHTYWRYRDLREKDGREELRDVIETKDGEIDRLLAINGEPLTPKQNRMEDSRIQELAAHPSKVRNEQQKQDDDNEKENRLLQLFPRAFSYEFAGGNGDIIRLSFTPNPHFHPTRREGQVFHHMEGTMWIDAHRKRLAGIDGHLTSRVLFGGGLLGHLDKGGTFSVKLKEVGAGHWGLDSLDVEMKGKALFFKTISVQQKESCANYKQIPGGMSLQRAAQALQQESSAAARAVTPNSLRN
jgi:hypothetical protein